MRTAEKSLGDSASVDALSLDKPVLRDATAADMAVVQSIYAAHVSHGTGTFEEVPPNVEEMTNRWRSILDKGLPYLVAGFDGQVQGFAYVAPFRPRSAYRHTIEDSIYVSPGTVGRGLARFLLGHLIERCTERGYRQTGVCPKHGVNGLKSILHRQRRTKSDQRPMRFGIIGSPSRVRPQPN